MPTQAMIRCECAFTYINAVSGKNLTALFSSMEVDAGVTQDSGGALRNVTDEARFRRTTAPQMPPSLLPTAAPSATRAAKNAARCVSVKLQIAKNIATSPADAIAFRSRLFDQRTAHEQGGPLLRSLCSPRLFFAFVPSGGIHER